MQLWEIIVPLKDNNGKRYSHNEFQRQLRIIFGGFTAYSVWGQWVEDHQIYTDESLAYRVLCEAEPALVSIAADHFDQLAFFVAHIGEGDVWKRPVPVQRGPAITTRGGG